MPNRSDARSKPAETPAACSPLDDRELVERFRDGDRRAFDELVRRHERAIFLLAFRALDHVEDARDVGQRTFVQAFQGIARFRGEAGFRTWIYRIALNLTASALRDRGRARRLYAESAAPGEIAEIEPAEPLPAREAARLRAEVAALPRKQRLVVELRVYHELSFREIAAVVGSSEESAKANFHHALKRLRALHEEEEAGR